MWHDRRMGEIELTTTLQPRGPAAAVVLSDAEVAEVGEGAKAFPVVATIGDYSWRTTVTRMRGEFLLGLNSEVRTGAGVEAGDTVAVRIALDAAPREVEVPEALAAALEGDAGPGRGTTRWRSRTARSSRGGSPRRRRTTRAIAVSPRRSRCCAPVRRAAERRAASLSSCDGRA